MTHPDPRFGEQLDREILLGQRLRASILTGVFAVGAGLLTLIVLTDALVARSVGMPTALPFVVGTLSVHQLVLRAYIDRRIGADRRIPQGFWYLNAFVEISTITVAIVVTTPSFANPVHALLTPALLGYSVFIVLSTLRLDFRTSLFTGALAAAEVAALSAYLLLRSDAPASFEPILDAPYTYVMKSFLLLASGLGAGFVARELRRRIVRSMAAVAEGERVQRADEAKTAFLANMSHEIRTPLNAIIGYAQLLEKEHSEDDRRHYLATIRSSGDHLLGVINQVLDLSRIEAGAEDLHLAGFDLPEVVREIGGMFDLRCRQSGLVWEVVLEGVTPRVVGDERRIRQVLINLLGNAVRFTREGSVTLRVTAASDGTSRFEVIDTGPGIPPDRQALVFEPFRQDEAGVRAGGSGLGLAIAAAQVRQMGGTLSVESEPGSGSRFSFALALPAAPDMPDRATVPRLAVAQLAPGCEVSAVVVDDVEANREVVRIALARIGAEVREAASGDETVRLVRARRPDILLLDVRMPELSGPETLRRLELEGLREGMRVVAVSASALDHERQACLAAGFDDFLVKPLVLERLYACLADQLGVAFEYERPAAPDVVREEDPGAATVSLPDPVWAALRAAAEEFNVTDLKKALESLDALGDEFRPLADRLRRMSRRYDMEAIVAALDEARAQAGVPADG